jgi:2-keto-4-pentenoate hydratase
LGRDMPVLKFERDPARIERGVSLLLALRRGEIKLEELPADSTPRTVAEAQEMHDRVTAALVDQILGWKYYFSYKAQEAPLRTAIYRCFDSPARIPRALSQLRLIEPELAFRLLRDLPARSKRYGHDEVADALEAVPAMEVIGARFTYASHDDLRRRIAGSRRFDRLADHNSNGAFVLGRGRKDWRDLDLWKMKVKMSQGDSTMVDSIGGHPFIDPFLPLFVLANDMREREGLLAGQILATSSYSGFYQVAADVTVLAEFSGFEPVEAVFD